MGRKPIECFDAVNIDLTNLVRMNIRVRRIVGERKAQSIYVEVATVVAE